ncbi:MAG: polyphosphate kinase 2 [Hyphomicrobiaceae bacterium]
MAKAEKGKSAQRGAASGPSFDIENPKLPKAIDDRALGSGGYPYDKKMKREEFEETLQRLQIELVKLQVHVGKARERIVVVFEGRDAAGKGSCIGRFSEHLNPRSARVVALGKPTETECGQWYFQRYAAQLPTAGEIVLFDRSWYNRAGVEQVMGFATEDQVADFLREAPQFEGMLVRDGIRFFKIYLEIGREMQLLRFHERRHDPLKRWKITDIDLAAMARWDDYTSAKEEMFRFTHTAVSPWTVVLANDQRRARLESIRVVLTALDYKGKDALAVGALDPAITGAGPAFFSRPL